MLLSGYYYKPQMFYSVFNVIFSQSNFLASFCTLEIFLFQLALFNFRKIKGGSVLFLSLFFFSLFSCPKYFSFYFFLYNDSLFYLFKGHLYLTCFFFYFWFLCYFSFSFYSNFESLFYSTSFFLQ